MTRACFLSSLLLAPVGQMASAGTTSVFTAPGYIDETIYQAMGSRSCSSTSPDACGRPRNAGRILVFKPNPNPVATFNEEFYEHPSGARPRSAPTRSLCSPTSQLYLDNGPQTLQLCHVPGFANAVNWIEFSLP
jgi:hypothetical protein